MSRTSRRVTRARDTQTLLLFSRKIHRVLLGALAVLQHQTRGSNSCTRLDNDVRHSRERFFTTLGEAGGAYLDAHNIPWVDWEDRTR